jgi:MPBQ/MSBQ methyltransferase
MMTQHITAGFVLSPLPAVGGPRSAWVRGSSRVHAPPATRAAAPPRVVVVPATASAGPQTTLQQQQGKKKEEEEPARRARGLIQHKREAFWFYRFLSIVYDVVVNPFHWTVEMRDRALTQAGLEERNDLLVVDVGGGTGFNTEGVVQYVSPQHVTLLDQSPHQMAKAKKKETLRGVTFVEGDAENLPFATDYADRYTSAGSIEYWPEPQRGIAEAYRVIKPGGMATIIGPVRATNPFSRFWCDLWMLFPMESEYVRWYEQAGFQDIKVSYIGPRAYKGVRQHGLIMGLTITGTKPLNGPSLPRVQLGDMLESREQPLSLTDRLLFLPKWIIGCIAGAYYFILPFLIILYAALFIRQPASADQH